MKRKSRKTSMAFVCALILGLGVLVGSLGARQGWTQDATEADGKLNAATSADFQSEINKRTVAHSSISKHKLSAKKLTGRGTGLETISSSDIVKAARKRFGPKVIYGIDNRKDWYQISDPGIRELASASVALFKRSDITVANTSTQLKTSTLNDRQGLCPTERFGGQRLGAFCSGALVGKDLVLTAGHCVREISNNPNIPYIDAVSFVFGFRVDAENDPGDTDLNLDQVYYGREVVDGELLGSRGKDWALVRLDREVGTQIANPVTMWRTDKIGDNAKVFVIGYPSGIPLKYAPGAQARENTNDVFFVANLDTFGGNSGSPVYDQDTMELVGVLVRGETDYVWDESQQCNIVNICPTTGCQGEDVTRISVVSRP